LLVYGSTAEVEDYCKQLIKDCAEGGGFVLAAECETPWDSKPDNIRAMIETAEKYGQY
jgi:uroporphyrinogen decarboxylase